MDHFTTHHVESTVKLFRVLSESVDENSACSPFSIGNVLAMLHAGADGATAEQIARGISLTDNVQSVYDGYTSVLENLKSETSIVLKAANKMYVQVGFEVLAKFSELAATKFLSVPVSVDFGDAQAASQLINGEVDKLTCGKVDRIVDASDLGDHVRMVIVNALYFKGMWSKPFDKELTTEQDFFISPKEQKTAWMMSSYDAELRYANLPDMSCKALELPYSGGKFSMLIILPNEVDGLAKAVYKLEAASLSCIFESLRTKSVNVVLPRFKVEAQFDLVKSLCSLGIEDIFDCSRANLSKITSEQKLFVSKCIHKTFVEVNEEGTEASAATAAVVMMRCCLVPDTVTFRADHPFIFFIVDRSSHLVLFAGKYVRPADDQ